MFDDHPNDACQQCSAGQIVRDLCSQYAKKIYNLLEELVDGLAKHSNAPQEAVLACTIFPQLTALAEMMDSIRDLLGEEKYRGAQDALEAALGRHWRKP